MNRQSQRGIALVITLVMLSVVTFMAVVFLALSRRERVSVKVSEDQATAKLMAESAIARAQAQAIATIRSHTNLLAYDLFVSTNYINGLGFQSSLGANITNVSYVHGDGSALSRNEMLQNIANLQLDPRVPVFAASNNNPNLSDFRFYLDFNRNGLFETNGLLPELDRTGAVIKETTGGKSRTVLVPLVGDPEWIGVLEHPDQPHSETNRFIGRYAFIALPSGKTLDLNYIHNQANTASDAMTTTTPRTYARNQGVGSWELNLAGFFRGLNTNIWRANSYQAYNPFQGAVGNGKGRAFDEALGVLAYRYNNDRKNLRTMAQNFSGPGTNSFGFDQVDSYADGPFQTYRGLGGFSVNDNDLPRTRPWSGSDNYYVFNDVQEIFSPKGTADYQLIKQDLDLASTNSRSTYDRYTFYRMLAQMGVDSPAAIPGKIHLNYTNLPGQIGTNLVPWTTAESPSVPTTKTNEFFLNAADAMIRQGVTLSVYNYNTRFGIFRATNYMIANDPYTLVRPSISVTNIQIYHVPPRTNLAATSNEYTAPLHRFLQVAANLYDNMTNRGASYPYLPSVFRPTFRGTATNVVIAGWVQEKGSDFLNTFAWRDASTLLDDTGSAGGRLWTNVMVYGQPMVIGAKKGYPNFNEFSVDTLAQVTRKLELVKLNTNTPVTIKSTNQMYLLGISNVFGIEAWNSYTSAFPRPLRIHAQVEVGLALSNVFGATTNLVFPLTGPSFFSMSTNLTVAANTWGGRVDPKLPDGVNPNSFRIPLVTNQLFLTNMVFLNRPPWFQVQTTNGFENAFKSPDWHLYVTNRVRYWVVDTLSGAVVDFVNLDKLRVEMPISQLLSRQASVDGELVHSSGYKEGDFWNTNTVVPGGPSLGVLTQIGISTNVGAISSSGSFWRAYSAASNDKTNSIAEFRAFLGLPNLREWTNGPTFKLGLAHQAPYAPVRKIFRRNSWQPNDPLVHYTEADLRDPIVRTDWVKVPDRVNPVPSGLGQLSRRYSPWGGSPLKDPTINRTSDRNVLLRDPMVRSSDDWEFPINTVTNKYFVFPTVGALGGVHRGTPWQTIYLKADAFQNPNPNITADLRQKLWVTNWANHIGSYPTNDWPIISLFTAAPNENAARGLMSVNQTNIAAWNALLAGVQVVSNTLTSYAASTNAIGTYTDLIIQPSSAQISNILTSVISLRGQYPGGVFPNFGTILSAPALSLNSPFLNPDTELPFGLTDRALEAIPRQILGLLRVDEPRFVIYAYGQALKPAERSLTTQVSFYNLCTNYQVTGEFLSKTVLRIEAPNGLSQPVRTVVENYSILPPSE